MNDTVILLGIGVILGALLSSGVWLVLFVFRKAERQLAREKSLVVKAVAEESAEADKVLSSAVAKSMNAHALRSALSPKIDKMQKMLTENMHVLDIYFVKYMESRIAEFRAAFGAGDPVRPRPAEDRYVGEAGPDRTDTSASVAEDYGARFESRTPPLSGAARTAPMNVSRPSPEEETIAVQPVAPAGHARMSTVQRVEPPPTDVRLGVIRVTEDVAEQRLKREPLPTRPQPRPPAPIPQTAERRPAPQAVPRPARPEAPKTPERELQAFDFEKEFGATVDKKARQEIVRPPEARAPHADRTEKTLQWDRTQLMGAAAVPPEAIVVEGAEIARKQPGPAPKKPPSPASNKEDNPIISGEDIESTMDSFFGLGDK
jgi:hypothetical protein